MIKTIILVAYFISLYLVIFWLLTLYEKGIRLAPRKLKKFPFVTICVPAYNEESNIKETIQSVIDLDYPRNKIEIIVVNDGSKDNTKKVVEKLIRENKDTNITLINQKNQGKGAAMNNAIRRAKGEFFVPLDADSIVQKEALKVLLPHFYKKNIVFKNIYFDNPRPTSETAILRDEEEDKFEDAFDFCNVIFKGCVDLEKKTKHKYAGKLVIDDYTVNSA